MLSFTEGVFEGLICSEEIGRERFVERSAFCRSNFC